MSFKLADAYVEFSERGVSGVLGKIGAMRGALTGVVGLLGAAGIGIGVGSMLQLASATEQSQVAFKVMLGDAEKAKKVLADIKTFAASTPFEVTELKQSVRTLLSFGMASESVMDSMRRLGDIAAGTQQPITELSAIYGKAMVNGRIQGEELNQLSERGIPIIKMLSAQYGVSAGEIRKMGERGELTFRDLQKVIQKMTDSGGVFFNMMKEQSETLGGKWSTFKDGTAAIVTALGELLVLKGDLKDFVSDISAFADAWSQAAEAARDAAAASKEASDEANGPASWLGAVMEKGADVWDVVGDGFKGAKYGVTQGINYGARAASFAADPLDTRKGEGVLGPVDSFLESLVDTTQEEADRLYKDFNDSMQAFSPSEQAQHSRERLAEEAARAEADAKIKAEKLVAAEKAKEIVGGWWDALGANAQAGRQAESNRELMAGWKESKTGGGLFDGLLGDTIDYALNAKKVVDEAESQQAGSVGMGLDSLAQSIQGAALTPHEKKLEDFGLRTANATEDAVEAIRQIKTGEKRTRFS